MSMLGAFSSLLPASVKLKSTFFFFCVFFFSFVGSVFISIISFLSKTKRVKIALDCGSEVNFRDSTGNSALTYAMTLRGRLDIIQVPSFLLI